MPDNYINGIQLIREYDFNTGEPKFVLPPKQTIQVPHFGLIYTGCGAADEGKIYLYDSQTGKPVISIEWGQIVDTKNLRYSLAMDIKDVNTGRQLLHEIWDRDYRYLEAWGISKYKPPGDEDWHYYLGNFTAAYYHDGNPDGDDDYMIGNGRTGDAKWHLVNGNTIEWINLREDDTSVFDAGWWVLSPFTFQPIFDDYMGVITQDKADNDRPEKINDTSDIDPKGGNGTETNRSDAIDAPNNTAELNSHSGVEAGFISLYSPSTSQLRSLASYLWTSDFVENVKKMFGDPMDVIIGLTQMPISIPTSGSTSVKAGFIDTGITMPRVLQQYIDMNMGTIKYGSYWGNALDFDPYTKVQIYLPFIGFRTLNTNDVINTSINLKYRFDVLTGACTAWIKCGNFIRYEFSGQCGASIPVTSQNYNNVINTAINIVSTVGTGIIGGVATGGLGTMASMATVNGISNVASGVASGGMKPTVQRSGGMGGASSLMGMRTPFLVFQRPKTSLPANYNNLYGYACNKYLKLGKCRGFTQVEHMHLQVAGATDDEMKEIENILHKGVFI